MTLTKGRKKKKKKFCRSDRSTHTPGDRDIVVSMVFINMRCLIPDQGCAVTGVDVVSSGFSIPVFLGGDGNVRAE